MMLFSRYAFRCYAMRYQIIALHRFVLHYYMLIILPAIHDITPRYRRHAIVDIAVWPFSLYTIDYTFRYAFFFYYCHSATSFTPS